MKVLNSNDVQLSISTKWALFLYYLWRYLSSFALIKKKRGIKPTKKTVPTLSKFLVTFSKYTFSKVHFHLHNPLKRYRQALLWLRRELSYQDIKKKVYIAEIVILFESETVYFSYNYSFIQSCSLSPFVLVTNSFPKQLRPWSQRVSSNFDRRLLLTWWREA